jgi:hypothetical protein
LLQLFKDAINFTNKNLGYRYLWIDSLCIVQDSLGDWIKQSASMGNIFKNSSLTLAAENTSIGLYQGTSKCRRRLFQVSYHIQKKIKNLKGTILIGQNRFSGPPFCGPLSSQSWTLQKTTLARRVIRFAKGQIWWRFHEHEYNEPDPIHFAPAKASIIQCGKLTSPASLSLENTRTLIHLGFEGSFDISGI